MNKTADLPWSYLEPYKGNLIKGEWPTFPELFTVQAERFGERPCFTDFDGPDGAKNTLTYSQVLEKIKILSSWMIASGVKKGDRIVVTGKNSPEWAVVYLSAFFAAGIIVPVDNALHENEVINLIKASSPALVFSDDEKIPYIKANFPDIPVFSLNPAAAENYVYNLKSDGEFSAADSVTENDTAAILFTSGTTGTPKGVMLSHKNLVSDGFIAQTNLSIFHTDVFYALLPIHHAYTMQAAFICPIECGAEIVFGKSMAVTKLMKELREGKITIMLGVPLLYNKLLAGIRKGIQSKGAVVSGVMSVLSGISFLVKKMTGKNIGKRLFRPVLQQANIYTLRVAICGGGPLASGVFRQYNAMGIDFIQGYGLTETSPIIALNPLEHFKIESVGRDFSPYEEIRIINAEKNDSNGRAVGEIVVKGPMVMQGYYNMPEETAKMFTEDGFLKTGDLGWMDSEHYIMLCGRAKNLIVTSGGKNVYPEEIEDAFQLCDDVQQIVVQAYYTDKDEKSEEIEALIYPSDQLYERLGISREQNFEDGRIREALDADVARVNRTLQPYSMITRIVILKEPMEMTTTQKVKRNHQ